MRTEKDEIIWANVEAILNKNRMSYADLAAAMGISPQSITSLKKNGIGIRSINKLAKALAVDSKALIVSPEQPFNSYPYNLHNKSTHEDIEFILNSENDDAISALKFGIRGVISAMSDSSKQTRLLEELVRGQNKVMEAMHDEFKELRDSLIPGDMGAAPVLAKK